MAARQCDSDRMDGFELSPDRAAFVEHEASVQGFSNASAYVEKLVDAAAQQKLEQLLLDGLNSDEVAWTPELLQQIRRDANLMA